jgi:CheY-like chemotaxis protein
MSAPRPVLVVDDDEDIRDTVALAIGVLGYDVRSAPDGEQAMALLGAGLQPSLILVDLMMPGMDGEAFIAALRSEPAQAAIPVVLLSGHNAARDRALQLHADACLVKPVELDELNDVVQRFAGAARTKP